VLAGPAAAQDRAPAPRYTASLLACAVFAEQVRTDIRSQSGSAVVQDRAGRDGVLILHATSLGDSIALEAWYDSLAVWRQSREVRLTPDTEGLLGGRFRGTLSPTGEYRSRAVPFVPDEVAEIADLAGELDDFLPRLAPTALAPGAGYRDSTGFRLRRLSDATTAFGRVQRYEWTRAQKATSTRQAEDTIEVGVEEAHLETGSLVWSPRDGPISWTRRIVVNARIPARGPVKRSLHSQVQQEIWVTRRLGHPACPRSP
jgi:hypothetical protein